MRKPQKLKIIVWRDKKSEYRWRMKRCGRIVAESGEGYKRAQACTRALCGIMACITRLNYSWETIKKRTK